MSNNWKPNEIAAWKKRFADVKRYRNSTLDEKPCGCRVVTYLHENGGLITETDYCEKHEKELE